MLDLELLKALQAAEDSEAQECPKCKGHPWKCDCWQEAALEAFPKLLAEVALLRGIVECGCAGGWVKVDWHKERECPDCRDDRKRWREMSRPKPDNLAGQAP